MSIEELGCSQLMYEVAAFSGLAGIVIGAVATKGIQAFYRTHADREDRMYPVPSRDIPLRYAAMELEGAGTAPISCAEDGFPRDSGAQEDEEPKEDYLPRTIPQALENDDSTITGIIREFYTTQEGFSGLIDDSNGIAAFYIEMQEYDEPEVALIPMILNDSLKQGKPVTLEVSVYIGTCVLGVERMNYEMLGSKLELVSSENLR